MSIDKISGKLVKHKHKGADIFDLSNYVGQPLGIFTTAYPTTPSVGMYEFAGTEGTVISSVTYYLGDRAYWNGTAWTRVASKSNGEFALKEDTFPCFQRWTSGNVTELIASSSAGESRTLGTILDAIKTLKIFGGNPSYVYKLQFISRNHSINKWRFIIKHRPRNGSANSFTTVFDATTNFTVTENATGVTSVFATGTGISIYAEIDYSKIANTKGYTIDTAANEPVFCIKPECIDTYFPIPKLVSDAIAAIKISNLADVPPLTGNANKYLKVKADETGVEFVETTSMADQSLNTTDDVEFSSITAGVIKTTGVIPTGTLATPPSGLDIGDQWADTTDSATHPIVRIKIA